MTELELGAQATQFLYERRTGEVFTFAGRISGVAVKQLINSGCVERLPTNDPAYSPGAHRITRYGAIISRRLPHYYRIVPRPKMDAPDLKAAQCICGYLSGATTEANAEHRGTVHVRMKKVLA